MKIGIIGCGSIGSRHARNTHQIGHAVYLYDADESRADALAAGLRRQTCSFDNVSALVSQHLDAMLICTPAATHADVAGQLLRDDYCGPLFVEKPLATTVTDAAVFAAWPHETTMVGYNWRWNPEVNAFIARHRHNMLWAHLRMDTRVSEWPGAAYGDPLLEASHEIDLVRHWAPDERFTGFGLLAGDKGLWLQSQTFLVDLRWDAAPARDYVVCYLSGRVRAIDRLTPAQASIDESYRLELAHFLACAAAGTPTLCPFADGRAVLQICADARRVTARGKITNSRAPVVLTG